MPNNKKTGSGPDLFPSPCTVSHSDEQLNAAWRAHTRDAVSESEDSSNVVVVDFGGKGPGPKKVKR